MLSFARSWPRSRSFRTFCAKGPGYSKESGLGLKTPKYYLENKERITLKSKKYREENKEKIKDYQQKNKERIAEAKKHYYQTNKAKFKEYQEKNREKIALQSHTRYLAQRPPPVFKSWKTFEDVRRHFHDIAQALLVRKPEDWYRVSNAQLCKHGGRTVLGKFGSLCEALKYAYPEQQWNDTEFSIRNKKSAQRWLLVQLQQLLPRDTEILEDFDKHPQLSFSSNLPMELDIWIPKYQLALEYQGEPHFADNYYQSGPYQTKEMYEERDREKALACEKAGITLICIPYWWDGDLLTLQATLHLSRPDLFPNSGASPIPDVDPKPAPNRLWKVPSMMHGVDWDKEDPTGWIMSEKMDGIRALWNGDQLITRHKNVINAPTWFISSLPRDVHLDGELWSRYNGLGHMVSILLRSAKKAPEELDDEIWKSVRFHIFDAPQHSGSYQQRHDFAQCVISTCDNHISIIPIQVCLGVDHLLSALDEIKAKEGEGLMLYHPSAPYTPGRTSDLKKVKVHDQSIVTYLSRSPRSLTFLCRQDNGASCVVKCPSAFYLDPPPVGSQLKVKHLGIYQKSKKLKSAVVMAHIKRDPGLTKKKSIEEILDSTSFSDSVPAFLIFDIETNDHPDTDPVMIELGWALFDASGKVLKGFPTSHLIQPEAFGPTYVNIATKEFHGISFEDLKGGTLLAEVIQRFSADLERVVTNEAGRVGSYNLLFDEQMLFKSIKEIFPSSFIQRMQTLFRERGMCVMQEVTKTEERRTALDVAFQKLSKLPQDTKLQLLEQNHRAGTDALIAGLVLFDIKQ